MAYEFDEFALDPETRRLLRDDNEVHLSPKAFDLLSLLIANRTRAMAKAHLLATLWPSTYVGETNLAGLVAELRRALGDSADDPRYIRTIQRFGYRFVGTLRQESNPGEVTKPGARYWLVWETRQIALNTGANVIGRAGDAEVWIDAAGVSRHHARITVDAGAAMLDDLDSTNGTYLRGARVTSPCRLADGDQIRLGAVVITFRIPGLADLTETSAM
ncbi:MAG: FHA domain-containing protein [Acidobacteriota bacterium]|nr:FHA domain-containing protein [Acidobacteriota bacterium]